MLYSKLRPNAQTVICNEKAASSMRSDRTNFQREAALHYSKTPDGVKYSNLAVRCGLSSNAHINTSLCNKIAYRTVPVDKIAASEHDSYLAFRSYKKRALDSVRDSSVRMAGKLYSAQRKYICRASLEAKQCVQNKQRQCRLTSGDTVRPASEIGQRYSNSDTRAFNNGRKTVQYKKDMQNDECGIPPSAGCIDGFKAYYDRTNQKHSLGVESSFRRGDESVQRSKHLDLIDYAYQSNTRLRGMEYFPSDFKMNNFTDREKLHSNLYGHMHTMNDYESRGFSRMSDSNTQFDSELRKWSTDYHGNSNDKNTDIYGQNINNDRMPPMDRYSRQTRVPSTYISRTRQNDTISTRTNIRDTTNKTTKTSTTNKTTKTSTINTTKNYLNDQERVFLIKERELMARRCVSEQKRNETNYIKGYQTAKHTSYKYAASYCPPKSRSSDQADAFGFRRAVQVGDITGAPDHGNPVETFFNNNFFTCTSYALSIRSRILQSAIYRFFGTCRISVNSIAHIFEFIPFILITSYIYMMRYLNSIKKIRRDAETFIKMFLSCCILSSKYWFDDYRVDERDASLIAWQAHSVYTHEIRILKHIGFDLSLSLRDILSVIEKENISARNTANDEDAYASPVKKGAYMEYMREGFVYQ